MPKQYILMADIIKSGLMTPGLLMQKFKEISRLINSDYEDRLYSPITITLGDEFQTVARSYKDGIQVIIAFEEMIIREKANFKIRYVLKYGEIKTPLNKEAAYGMLGPGLTEARKLLAEKKRSAQRFHFFLKDVVASEKMSLAFILYQSLVDRWKIDDFALITELLKESDYKIVAKKLGKDTSLIWRRKKSLKINEYLAMKKLIDLVQS
jgi:hypothetical protein